MSTRTVWCVGRNFDEHARELGNPVSRGEPLIFLKPASAVANSPESFVMPVGSSDVQPEVEIVFRVARNIRAPLTAEQAWQCVDAWTVGLDWTARDLQTQAKAKGHPWVRAKGFRQSATLGDWCEIPAGQTQAAWSGLSFELHVQGQLKQRARLADAVFTLADVLVFLSQWTDLEAGDVLFMGTPAGVSSVQGGVQLEAAAELQWASGAVRSAISLKTRNA